MNKKIVLLVDDDADLTKVLKFRIESEGYEFMSVKDGQELLDTLKTKRPDIILLDIMLPNMDGYSALREIRKNEAAADMPVIILSAKEKKKLGDLFALEKIAYFIEKPFDTKELMEKIRESLNKAELRGT